MSDFIIIGENIHTTRSVKRGGIRTSIVDDQEVLIFNKKKDNFDYMEIPEVFKNTQPYQQGQLKHFMIAIWQGINGDQKRKNQVISYIKSEIKRQINNGATFLDINVDEYSYKLDQQISAMKWVVGIMKEFSDVPLSVDSSNIDIIKEGLIEYNNIKRPLVNSLSLERVDLLDIILEQNCKVVVSAASESSMPESSDERIINLSKMMDISLSKGIKEEDIFIDPLIFPISVASNYGIDALEAIKKIRKIWPKVNITGGMSNISFGLPKRRLINDVFIHLAIKNGANSGIINPIESKLDRIIHMDQNLNQYKITKNMLEGNDEFCTEYLTAYRENKL